MKASLKAKKLIQQHEGLRLTAYLCPAKKWSIGYGHTGPDVTPGLTITTAQAAALFESDLNPVEDRISSWMTAANISFTQGQFDALCSFAYNVGLTNLRNSTLWRKATANPADPTILAEFGKWVYAKGVKLPGLVKRRQSEVKLWSEKC